MENEMRFYLKKIRQTIVSEKNDYKPTYFITAVRLPSGAIELAINTTDIVEKIDYILEAYDSEMRLKTNTEITMEQLMVV